MMNPLLHRQPVAVDRDQHRNARVHVPVTDWHVADDMNSVLVTAAEFGPACREYPVVFVPAGNDETGAAMIAPVAVLGLGPKENLYVDAAGHWRSHYLPMLLRAYPFGIQRIDPQRFAVCIDSAYAGFSAATGEAGAGEALFAADGQPTEYLGKVQKMLEQIETELQRTRAFCRRLQDLKLMRETRLDATLPAGQKIAVDGFMMVDEEKLKALPDADVLEMHRNGMFGLIHGHFLSLGHMQRLVEWRAARAALQ